MAKDKKLEIEDIKEPEPAKDTPEKDDIDIEEAVAEGEEAEKTPETEEPEAKDMSIDKEPEEEKKDVLEKVLEDTDNEPEEELPKFKSRNRKNWVRPVTIAVVAILVTAALVLGGVYYYLNFYKKKADTPAPTENTEVTEEPVSEEPAVEETGFVYIISDVGLNLREKADAKSKVLIIIPYGTKVEVLAEKTGWINTSYDGKKGWVSAEFTSPSDPTVYINKTYGFKLKFPLTWPGYKFFETTLSGSDALAVYYVALPTTDAKWKETGGVESGYASLFVMGIYTPAEWAKISGTEGPALALIQKTSKYVYTWLPAQAAPKDLLKRFNDPASIIKTFELLK